MTGTLPWAVAALAAVAAMLAVVGISLGWASWRASRTHERVVSRLRADDGPPPAIEAEDLFREDVEEAAAWSDFFEQVPRSDDLRILLEQADVGWSRAWFLAWTVLSILAGWGLGWVITGVPLASIAPAILAGTAPYLYLVWRKRKRVEAFEAIFPEAIDLMGRSIRAGHAFTTGLQMVAEELSEPVAFEFRRVFEEQKYGLPLEDSLYDLAARVDLVDVRIFATAVLIQREVGGNLAEILDNLSQTIRDRFKIQRQVRIHTAQGRMTGYLLAILPFAAAFLIFLLNPEYMSVLWTETAGRLMIMVALLLQVLGFFWIRKIVNIEV